MKRIALWLLPFLVAAMEVQAASEVRPRTLLKIVSSGGPFSTTWQVFSDGSFQIFQRGSRPGPGSSRTPLEEGQLLADELASLEKQIEGSGLLSAGFEQDEDPNLLCEGGFTISLRKGRERNVLSTPCVGDPDGQTQELTKKMRQLSSSVTALLTPRAQPAPEGLYVEVHTMGRSTSKETPPLASLGEEYVHAARTTCLVRVAGWEQLAQIRALHRKEYSRGKGLYLAMFYGLRGGTLQDFDSLPEDVGGDPESQNGWMTEGN